MTWTWDQSAGTMSHDGKLVSSGYSGNTRGLNNPAMQNVPNVGPIPRGRWTIVSKGDSPHTGRFTIVLTPVKGTNTEGRSEFRIHGDNPKKDHSASHGCIILPLDARTKIWASGDRDLQVVA